MIKNPAPYRLNLCSQLEQEAMGDISQPWKPPPTHRPLSLGSYSTHRQKKSADCRPSQCEQVAQFFQLLGILCVAIVVDF